MVLATARFRFSWLEKYYEDIFETWGVTEIGEKIQYRSCRRAVIVFESNFRSA